MPGSGVQQRGAAVDAPAGARSLAGAFVAGVLAASLNTGRDRVAKSRFTFEMADPKHLGHVLRAVRQVEGVFDAYRVTG